MPRKLNISKRDEKDAALRNSLTLPLTVLEMIAQGKEVPKTDVLMALKKLRLFVKRI